MSYMTIQVLDGDQQVMIKALLLSANNRPVSHYDVLTNAARNNRADHPQLERTR